MENYKVRILLMLSSGVIFINNMLLDLGQWLVLMAQKEAMKQGMNFPKNHKKK